MLNIEKTDTELLHCPECKTQYNENAMKLICQHNMCKECVENALKLCTPVSRIPAPQVDNTPFSSQWKTFTAENLFNSRKCLFRQIKCTVCKQMTISSLVVENEWINKLSRESKELKSREEQLARENEYLKRELGDKIVQLEAQLIKKPINPIDCSSCRECYPENKMFMCKTCSMPANGENPSEAIIRQNVINVKSSGLCSNCIVMDHIVQKHEVVPLFPVLALMQHANHSIEINKKKQSFDEKFSKVTQLSEGLVSLSDVFAEYIQTTSEMIKKSKSSTYQVEFNKFIDENVDDFNNFVGKIERDLIRRSKRFIEKLNKYNATVSAMCTEKCTNVDEFSTSLLELINKQEAISESGKLGEEELEEIATITIDSE